MSFLIVTAPVPVELIEPVNWFKGLSRLTAPAPAR